MLDLLIRNARICDGVLTREKAVHKLTQVPATVFGIPDHGVHTGAMPGRILRSHE